MPGDLARPRDATTPRAWTTCLDEVASATTSPMQVGLDRLLEQPKLVERLRGSRVGLLAHPASVDRRLRHVGDVLAELGVRPRIFFGPEHGYGGEAQDMIGVESAV